MGILPCLVRNLAVNSPTSSVTLVFESAWALTNIASTECGIDVARAGAIKPLICLLDHREVQVRDQAIWCLGNIAGEGPEQRDLILKEQPINLLYVLYLSRRCYSIFFIVSHLNVSLECFKNVFAGLQILVNVDTWIIYKISSGQCRICAEENPSHRRT